MPLKNHSVASVAQIMSQTLVEDIRLLVFFSLDNLLTGCPLFSISLASRMSPKKQIVFMSCLQ